VITYQEAIRIIDEHAQVLGRGIRPVTECSEYFLGEDVVALNDSPPFDCSAVDGYGRRAEDLASPILALAGQVRAGDSGDVRLQVGQCVRILTGAPVPPDVAAISMQEDCRETEEGVQFLENAQAGQHIRGAGSDFRQDDLLLVRGSRMNPASVGIAVSGGHQRLEVMVKPRIHVITTGDELVSAGEPLNRGQIYNSNEAALGDALRNLSSRTHFWHCQDDPAALKDRLFVALHEEDVILTVGGVSVGSHDYVKEVLGDLGAEEKFWRVSIKPGKPIYFGIKGKTVVFGLPGNPVSALVTYFLFARPAILKMMGHPDPWPKPVKARFEGEARKNPGRMEFLRGTISGDGSRAIAKGGQDSHMLSGLATANCLIHFPLEATELNTGDEVEVTMLNWGLS